MLRALWNSCNLITFRFLPFLGYKYRYIRWEIQDKEGNRILAGLWRGWARSEISAIAKALQMATPFYSGKATQISFDANWLRASEVAE